MSHVLRNTALPWKPLKEARFAQSKQFRTHPSPRGLTAFVETGVGHPGKGMLHLEFREVPEDSFPALSFLF